MPRLIELHTLALGTRFATDSGKRGTLLYVNECRARVKWDGAARHIELSDGRAFDVAGAPQDISPRTEVREVSV